jgi:hypothetical protein
MTPFEEGHFSMMRALGLEKVAFQAPGWLKGVGTSFKEGLIGSPVAFGKEVMSGKAFTGKGMLAEGLRAPGMFNKALLYGLPTYMGYNIMKGNDPDKAQQLGGLAASTLGTAAMYKPFGMLGGMLAMPALDRIGRGAVTVGQKLTGTFNSNPRNPYQQYQQQNTQPYNPQRQM